MTNIVTITFNPAIDKSTTIPLLIPEKKLYCSKPVYEPGGGGINVARAIKRLGGSATAIYLAGGYSGAFFTDLLKKEEIPIFPIQTLGLTRENLVVKELSTNKQFRFGMPGDSVNAEEWENCIRVLSGISGLKYTVVSGSLPAGIPEDIFIKIARVTHSKNAKLIVDTSGAALNRALEAGSYLIKPNLKELAQLAGIENLSIDHVKEVAKEIINKYTCEVVITSLGADGAFLITKEHSMRIIPPKVNIQSTVGAGDSMLAGIVLSLSDNRNIIQAAQYGVACGTAATMNQGTELCHLNDAQILYHMMTDQQ